MAKVFNRVAVVTATTGTGTVTLGAAISAAFFTFAEGGVANGDVVTYLITEGTNSEIGRGTYTTSGTTLSRDTVLISKVSGTAGTTKITLGGAAEVRITAAKEDMAYPRVIAKSGNYTAVAGDLVVVTTAGSTVTITLPAAPFQDDRVSINYYSQTAGDKVVIGRNAKKIAGVSADMELYVADNTLGLHDNVVLQYDLTNTNWVVVDDGIVCHRAKMTRATTQAIASATGNQKILFDTEIYDVGGIADPTTNDRFNIKRAGQYHIISQCSSPTTIDVGEFWLVDVYLNAGLLFRAEGKSFATDSKLDVNAIFTGVFAAGDYLEMQIYQTEGASQNTPVAGTGHIIPAMSVTEIR